MLALCLMLSATYYAQNYAGIINQQVPSKNPPRQVMSVFKLKRYFWTTPLSWSSDIKGNNGLNMDTMVLIMDN